MMITIRKNILLILLSGTLLACANTQQHTQTETEERSDHATEQQQQQMLDMQPKFLYLAAQNALKDGNQKLATAFLKALVAKDPGAVDPHIQLAGLLLQQGQSVEAEQEIEQLLNKELKESDQEKLLLTQARLKVSGNKFDEALHLLDNLFKVNPVNLAGRDLQVRILSGQERTAEALAALDQAISIEELAEFRLLQAQLLLRKKQFREAEISLLRMRKLAPENDTAVLMLSSIAMQEKQSDKAEAILREFYSEFPAALRVGHALGKIMMQEKRLAEAIIIYRNLVQQSGDNPELLKTLGMLYFSYKDYEKSEQTFRKLHENQASDMSRFYLAASLEALEKPEQARALYEQIDAKGEQGAEAQLRLAGMDFAEERLNSAMSRLNMVLESQPEHTEAHLMRSGIRLAQKKYQTVIDETAPLLTSGKPHPQLLFNRAVAFDHLKQHEQVEIMLNRLLADHPDHAEALNFLAYSYAVQGGKLDKAEQLVRKALSLKPDDGYYLDTLAWIYYKQGNYKKALSTQKRALNQIKDDAIMFEHLGDMHWQLGDKTSARQAWQQAIDMKAEASETIRNKIRHGLRAE